MRYVSIILFTVFCIPFSGIAQKGAKDKKRPKVKSKICIEWKDGNSTVKDHYDTVSIQRYFRDGTNNYNAEFYDGELYELTTLLREGRGKNSISTSRFYLRHEDTMYLSQENTFHKRSKTKTETNFRGSKQISFESMSPKTEHEIYIDEDGTKFESTYNLKTKVQTELYTNAEGDTTEIDFYHFNKYGRTKEHYYGESFGNYPDTAVTWKGYFDRDKKGRLLKSRMYDLNGLIEMKVIEYDAKNRKIKEALYKAVDTVYSETFFTYSSAGKTKTRYDYRKGKVYQKTISYDDADAIISELKLKKNGDTISCITNLQTGAGLIKTTYPTKENKGALSRIWYNEAGKVTREVTCENYADTTQHIVYAYDDKNRLISRKGFRMASARRAPIREELEYIPSKSGLRKIHRMTKSTTITESDKSGNVLLKTSINPRGDTVNVETFTRDKAGRILEQTETRWGYKTTFVYDKKGNLIEKKKIDPYGRAVTIRKYLYEYY